MKSNSDVRPPILQNLGNGSLYYNYNIMEVELPAETIKETEGETEEAEGKETPAVRTGYDYETVEVWGNPDYDKCVKAVLRSRRDETEEFSLINKYNASVFGIAKDEAAETEYKAYLQEVVAVKAMVRSDLMAAGLNVEP